MLCNEDATQKETGPCLEYFLQEHLLDTLCAYGQVDRPPGMMSLVLQTLNNLLLDMRQPLLNLQQVQVPLRQLILACAQRHSPSTREHYVDFVVTLCSKVQSDPDLLVYLMDEKKDSVTRELTYEFLIFTALLPFLNENNNYGARAREGVIYCLEMESAEVTKFVTQHTDFCEQVVQGLVGLFTTLPDLESDAAPGIGSGASSALSFYERLQFLNSIVCVAQEDVVYQMVRAVDRDFFRGVVEPALRKTNERSALAATSYTRAIVQQLDSSPLLTALVEFLLGPDAKEEYSLRKLLISRMDSMNEQLSIVAMQLFDALLALHHRHVLRVLVLEALAENNHFDENAVDAPATPAAADGADPLSAPTGGPSAPVRSFLAMSPSRAGIAQGGDGASAAAGLSRSLDGLAGIGDVTGDGSAVDSVLATNGFGAYLIDAQRQTAMTLQAFESWNDESEDEEEHAAILQRLAELGGMAGVDESDEAAGGSGEAGSAPASPAAPSTPARAVPFDPQTPMSHRRVGKGEYSETTFMRVLFNKLEGLLDQSLDFDLVLTGLLAKLAQSPHPLVGEFFLDGTLPLKSNVRTVPRVLKAVSIEAKERGERLGDFVARLEAVRTELAVDVDDAAPAAGGEEEDPAQGKKRGGKRGGKRAASPAGGEVRARAVSNEVMADDFDVEESNTKRFLQAVVVLEEFCKELAAIVHAKEGIQDFP